MKRIDNRSVIALALTLTIIGSGALYFGWQFSRLSQTGWAGFAYFYQPNQEKVEEISPLLHPFMRPPGEVAILIPGGAADQSGLQRGDRIVSVNGLPISEQAKLRNLARQLRPGDEVEIELMRGDVQKRITLSLGAATESGTQVISIATSLITGIGYLVISVLLFTAGTRSRGALLFFQLCVIGSFLFLFSAAFEFEMNDSQGIVPVGSELWMLLILAIYLLLGMVMMNLLLHFSLVFPRKAPILERRPAILVWLHLAPFTIPIALIFATLTMDWVDRSNILLFAVVFVLALGWLAVRLLRSGTGWRAAALERPAMVVSFLTLVVCAVLAGLKLIGTGPAVFTWVALFLLAFFGSFAWSTAYLLTTLVNFIRSYRATSGDEKRQLRWPLWGTIVSLLSSVLLAIVLIIGVSIDPPLNLTHPHVFAGLGAVMKFCYLLMPFSFGLGIQKYGLMQVDTILRKTFVYAAVTTIVILIYLLIVGVFGIALVSMAGVENQILTVAATLIVAALFVPLRNRVQTFVDARFFKRQQDYDDVRRSLARIIATSRDLDEFLDTASSTVRSALGVPRLLFFCREASGEGLVLRRVSGGTRESADRHHIEPGDPLASPGPRVVDLLQSSASPIEERYAVRLQTSEGVVGIVAIADRPRDPLSEDDLEFLAGIADQLALGVASLQIRTDDLELVQARQIQRSLLPAQIPQLRGFQIATAWIPARSVGGDYYDVLSLSDSKLAFCVGDVVGKGMPAALLMSGLQSAVRAIAPADASTDVTVKGIRRVAAQNLTGGKFITFFYATIDTDRHLSFTNAGHNEPLLVRSDGRIERLSAAGAAIARMMHDADLSSETLQLRRGDTIVVFTDGVTEAPSAASDDPETVYGEDRLIELVREHRDRDAEDLVGRIVDDVRQFTGGDFGDDLTLVVLKV